MSKISLPLGVSLSPMRPFAKHVNDAVLRGLEVVVPEEVRFRRRGGSVSARRVHHRPRPLSCRRRPGDRPRGLRRQRR